MNRGASRMYSSQTGGPGSDTGTSRRTCILVLVVGLSVLCAGMCLVSGLIGAVLLARSQELSEPLPAHDPEMYLVPLRALPHGWRMVPSASLRGSWELFRHRHALAETHFEAPEHRQPIGSGVHHAVASYRSEARAHQSFVDLTRNSYGNYDPWPEMEAWIPQSGADEWTVHYALESWPDGACIARCKYVARYRRYVSKLVVIVDSRDMSPAELKALIQAADERFAHVPE